MSIGSNGHAREIITKNYGVAEIANCPSTRKQSLSIRLSVLAGKLSLENSIAWHAI